MSSQESFRERVLSVRNTINSIQNLVDSSKRKSKRSAPPLYIPDNLGEISSYQSPALIQRLRESGIFERQAQGASQDELRQKFLEAVSSLPRLPKDTDLTSYKRTYVRPQIFPAIPSKLRNRLLELASYKDDPLLGKQAEEAQQMLDMGRQIPWGVDYSEERKGALRRIRDIKKQLSTARERKIQSDRELSETEPSYVAGGEDSTVRDLERTLANMQSDFNETDYGVQRGYRVEDPQARDFENKRETLGNCATDTTMAKQDIFFPRIETRRNDPTRMAHTESMASRICSTCPLEEECHRYRIINHEDEVRGPASSELNRKVRGLLIGSLTPIKNAQLDVLPSDKVPDITSILDPRKSRDLNANNTSLPEVHD